MQLSVGSWLLVGFGVLIIVSVLALWIYTVICVIKNKPSDNLLYLCIIGLAIFLLSCLVVGIVSAGGLRAHDIKRDLTSQGYTVFHIETDANTAIVLLDGFAHEVQVINDGEAWRPHLSCPVSPDGEISNQLIACRIVPSEDGLY